MITVGLTGGIGSGKSIVARVFEILGCVVFNSDQVAKAVYYDARVKEQVEKLLGSGAYETGHINKKYISEKIFSDTILLHKLNAIIHPAVIDEFRKFKSLHNGKIIIKESALLFEARLTGETEKIIVVAAPDELRIKRVMQREAVTREEVEKKIKSQLPQEEKIKKADYVIHNNEEEFVLKQVIDIYQRILKLPHA